MHKSVLLEESIDGLNIKENGVYVDCTLGFGGHSSEILKRLKKGLLIAIDQDDMAIKASKERLSKISDNYEIIKCNFVRMKEELLKRGISKVDGILFDLGVSSPQLDIDERGFSYHHDAKLDMRMDQSKGFSAYDVVNTYDYDKLVKIFREYRARGSRVIVIGEHISEIIFPIMFYQPHGLQIQRTIPEIDFVSGLFHVQFHSRIGKL